MRPSLLLATASLILAAPTEDAVEKRAITSGTNDGSIFQFGDAARCRRTFYDSGACGLSTYFKGRVPADATLVAVPSGVFDRYGQAQDNRLCGKTITMTYRGVTRRAVVADENTSGEQSIDMCLDDWKAFGGKDGDGTLRKGIKWTIG
ncbi:hypothetical protein ISF_00387 [Cordyceps fumosorosea ARSEF 2679]|uniref:Barwin-related endoglucanase n=1 Tax=Cordyceps fumosorosea (strain ARSEF 2679) TaxID=1081104 RepID=A0A168E841_CORFA|nr:hypothetical protein ISF_00387 [Cordyceps fumosorosea ARSEF 2679]OAA73486.1 hypothetical protein ISF_00387 [Cordyceps fumosorosea ARSEF 2679]